MKNMHDLNFFPEPMNKNFVMPADDTAIAFQHRQTPLFWTYVREEGHSVVKQEILDWIDTKNLKMHAVNIFKTPPHFVAGIHIDGGGEDYLLPTVNWVMSGLDSEQIYYRPESGLTVTDCFIPGSYNKEDYYRPFDESKLVEVERKRIVGPTLIRINVPHRVANYDDEWRLTISLRFEHKNNKSLSWIEILKLFKDHLK
jgi:hypothetical protein